MFLCVNESTQFNWVVNGKINSSFNLFYLYSSEVISLGSFVSKRLNLYFEQLYQYLNLSNLENKTTLEKSFKIFYLELMVI